MTAGREMILGRIRSAYRAGEMGPPEDLGPSPEEILPPGTDLMSRFKEHWQAAAGEFHLAKTPKGLTQK